MQYVQYVEYTLVPANHIQHNIQHNILNYAQPGFTTQLEMILPVVFVALEPGLWSVSLVLIL